MANEINISTHLSQTIYYNKSFPSTLSLTDSLSFILTASARLFCLNSTHKLHVCLLYVGFYAVNKFILFCRCAQHNFLPMYNVDVAIIIIAIVVGRTTQSERVSE
jgi:hypothetical protein